MFYECSRCASGTDCRGRTFRAASEAVTVREAATVFPGYDGYALVLGGNTPTDVALLNDRTLGPPLATTFASSSVALVRTTPSDFLVVATETSGAQRLHEIGFDGTMTDRGVYPEFPDGLTITSWVLDMEGRLYVLGPRLADTYALYRFGVDGSIEMLYEHVDRGPFGFRGRRLITGP